MAARADAVGMLIANDGRRDILLSPHGATKRCYENWRRQIERMQAACRKHGWTKIWYDSNRTRYLAAVKALDSPKYSFVSRMAGAVRATQLFGSYDEYMRLLEHEFDADYVGDGGVGNDPRFANEDVKETVYSYSGDDGAFYAKFTKEQWDAALTLEGVTKLAVAQAEVADLRREIEETGGEGLWRGLACHGPYPTAAEIAEKEAEFAPVIAEIAAGGATAAS